MAYQTHLAAIDLAPRFEIHHARLAVHRKVSCCSASELAVRFADSPFVRAQYGDAVACQIIREDQEGPVIVHGFVAIQRA